MLLSLSGFLIENPDRSLSLSNLDFLRLARSCGYDGVELRESQIAVNSTVAQRKELLNQLKELGLTVTCYAPRGLPPDSTEHERDKALQRSLELCEDLCCSLLKIRGNPEWLIKACSRASESNVVLATNNHIGTSTETVEGTLRLLEAVNNPNFKLLYDAMHLSVAQQPYLACIAKFAPRVGNILIQSVRPMRAGETAIIEYGKARWVKALPDETSTIDWRTVLAAFRTAEYNGLITVIENNWPVKQQRHVASRCANLIREWWK